MRPQAPPPSQFSFVVVVLFQSCKLDRISTPAATLSQKATKKSFEGESTIAELFIFLETMTLDETKIA